jgi:hypothetical protein
MGIIDYLFSPSTMPYSKTFLTLQIFYLLYVIIDTHIGNDYKGFYLLCDLAHTSSLSMLNL